jgi:ankyrin repeat protein
LIYLFIQNRNTALHIATERNRKGAVEILINHNADVNRQNQVAHTDCAAPVSSIYYDFFAAQAGLTPLMLAAELGLEEILAILLQVPTINCRLVDNDKYTALILAAQNQHPGAVKQLCKHDPSADHLEIKNKFGKTSLFLAAEVGDLESLRILVSNGANPNTFSNRSVSPLMIAATLDKKSTFTFLVSPINNPVANLEIVSAAHQTVPE